MPVTFNDDKRYTLPAQDWMIHFNELRRIALGLVKEEFSTVRASATLKTAQGATISEDTLQKALSVASDNRLDVISADVSFYVRGPMFGPVMELSGKPSEPDVHVWLRTESEGFFRVAKARMAREIDAINTTVAEGRETDAQVAARQGLAAPSVVPSAEGRSNNPTEAASESPVPHSRTSRFPRAATAWVLSIVAAVVAAGISKALGWI